MHYKKELAAMREYIANFDPEEFSSTAGDQFLSIPTPEQLAGIQKFKSRLRRKRQIAESLQCLLGKDLNCSAEIISQEEVDALLEGWTA